jgi:DNA repair protein RecN (Recombination protein N)
MIKDIVIKHFALIEKGSLDFDPNLNFITGESASGKSLIIKAITFALGKKINPDPIKKPSSFCEVSLTIELNPKTHNELLSFLMENELLEKDCTTIVLRRKQSESSKFYINDTPCSASIIKKINEFLFEILSQNESKNLLEEKNQLSFIDSLIEQSIIRNYKEKYSELMTLKKEKEDLEKKLKNKDDELSFLEFRLKEINDLKINEDDLKLEEKITFLENFKDINENLNIIENALLGEDDSINAKIDFLKKRINIFSKKYNSPIIQESIDLLKKIEELTELLSEKILSPKKDFDNDDENLEALYNKAQSIKKLKTKYGSIEGIIEKQKDLEEQISVLNSLDDILIKLNKEEVKIQNELNTTAKKLTSSRINKSKNLEKEVTKIINDLNMPDAVFKINITKLESFSPNGQDGIVFLIKSNKGSDFLPTSKIASGGELSRLTLALYNAASLKNNKIFIFDEIDSGIGGNTSLFLAKKIKELSNLNQVISITHSPQIAAFATNHIKVEKVSMKNFTESQISNIKNKDDRIKEISRMLGDSVSPEASKKLAIELLKNN